MELTGWWIGSACYVVWPLRMCVASKDWRSETVPLYKGKGERGVNGLG